MFSRLFLILIFLSSALSAFQIKIPNDAKKLLRKSGISEKQAKNLIQNNSSDLIMEKPVKNNTVNSEETKKQLDNIYKLDESSNVRANESEIISTSNDEIVENVDGNDLPQSDLEFSDSVEDNLEYFGYSIFNNNPELFQQSIEESVDPNYIIGPGDEIIIMLWGETEFNQSYRVSRDGYLFIDNVGQVFVNGLIVEKLEKKLFKLLKKVYSSLGPNSGTGQTFFDVSLGAQSLRPLRIFALGEISSPGAYEVKQSASIFTSLYYFNGPRISGSLRDIKLIRSGKEIGSIDYYDYLISGKQVNDSKLQRDDVIFIPLRGKTISVAGEINRSGIYELKDDESLKDLIKYAGGLLATTYLKRAQIERILNPTERLLKGIDRTLIDVSLADLLEDSRDYKLFDGDKIRFFKISDNVENIVNISGSVNRPGDYNYFEGARINDIIEKADGLNNDVYFEKADIFRIAKDNIKEHISIDLSKSILGDLDHNIELKSGDEIIIYQLSDRVFNANVSITGHVRNPGSKEFRKGMDVADLVFLGGGFNDDSHLSNTYFARAELTRFDILRKKSSLITFRLDSVLAGLGISNMQLEMGDQIRIFSLEEIKGLPEQNITMEGYVKRPGVYNYSDGISIMDLLFRGGGLEDSFYKKSTYLEKADIIRMDENRFSKKIFSFSINNIINGIEPDFPLERGDKVRLYSSRMFNNNPTVFVNGAVRNSGNFFLKSNMTAIDAILEAGGIADNVLYSKVEISRLNPESVSENKYAEIFTINLKNDSTIFHLSKNSSKASNSGSNSTYDNISLEPFDVITVREDPYFQLPKIVSISGKVHYPGEYVITSPTELVTDIIKRAGGLKEDAYPLASSLNRNDQIINLSFDKIIKNPKSKLNFVVQNGDVINIGYKRNLVTIEGEINSPGNYQFIKGAKLSDYIKMAGGLTQSAAKNGIIVSSPNGRSKKKPFIGFSPAVNDGSTILVKAKEEVEPFSFTEFATNLTSIYADLSQAYLLIILAQNN